MHKRPLTRERLARVEICQETNCVISGEVLETTEHLYFECPFSKVHTRSIGMDEYGGAAMGAKWNLEKND